MKNLMRRLGALTAIGALAGALVVGAAVPASATNDNVCRQAGYETKVDTHDNPATVSYTAPAGKLVDSYCVKAGPSYTIVPVNPPAATVIIDHPDKDSVSHYQVRLIDIPTPPRPDSLRGFETRSSAPVCTIPLDGSGVVTHERRTWLQQHIFVNGAWVLGDKNFTVWGVTGTETVQAEVCLPAIPPQPEDKVTYTQWADGQYGCGDTSVTQTRIKTVVASILVNRQWVAGTPVVTPETQSRALTADELAALEDECFVPPVFTQCVTNGSTQFTDLGAWNLTETRSAGHNVLVENGLHVYTDDATSNAKAAGYLPVNFALKDYGTFDIDWTGTAPAPGGQMLVDLDNDGTPTGYLVIEDAYNGEWWLSANWGGDVPAADLPVSAVGGGGADWASPQEFLNAFPDARILAIGYSLGSGVKGDGVINSITAGCHVYTFDLPTVTEPEKPADIVTTDSVETTDCGTDTVTTVTTTTTIGHVLVNNVWVPAEPLVTTASSERPATDEECPPVVVPPVETCADFDTQADAQAAFNADPVKYAGLDGDGDGVACESATVPPVTPNPEPEPSTPDWGDRTTPLPAATLAATGVEVGTWVAVGLIALLAAGIGVWALVATRRKNLAAE